MRPSALCRPIADALARYCSHTLGIHIVIFDIIGPGDAILHFGERVGGERSSEFVEFRFC